MGRPPAPRALRYLRHGKPAPRPAEPVNVAALTVALAAGKPEHGLHVRSFRIEGAHAFGARAGDVVHPVPLGTLLRVPKVQPLPHRVAYIRLPGESHWRVLSEDGEVYGFTDAERAHITALLDHGDPSVRIRHLEAVRT